MVIAKNKDRFQQEPHRTLVVGLGQSGLSCLRCLASENVPLAVTDSRSNPPGLQELREHFPDMAVFLGDFDADAFNAAERIVLSPGVSLKEPLIVDALRRGVPVLGDVELFAQRVSVPVLAISGSNGKSTVTQLVAEMIMEAGKKVCVGGNIGVPALNLLSQSTPDFYVLELSSFQLETTYSLNPVAAVILNISPDHMDRYQDLDEYISTKKRIFNGTGTIVVNRDDPVLNTPSIPGRDQCSFGLGEAKNNNLGQQIVEGQSWLAQGENVLMPANEIVMTGQHSTANVLAAIALGDAIRLPMASMLRVARRFRGLPHRMQLVAEAHRVRWYDDSKGTNVGATVAAVAGVPGQVVLIAGGLGKGADFLPLRSSLMAKGRAAVLLGKDAEKIEAVLDGVIPIKRAGSMDEAVALAQDIAQPGDSVLLSPACASFDMFSGFEERGNIFIAEVRKLLA